MPKTIFKKGSHVYPGEFLYVHTEGPCSEAEFMYLL